MKIDYELKIQKKYADAILRLEKPFELRHKPIPKGSIVKLVEIEGPILMNMGRHPTKKSKVYFPTGRYIIFRSGECKLFSNILISKEDFERKYKYWWDNFLDNYINKKQTYLIEIDEILEVK